MSTTRHKNCDPNSHHMSIIQACENDWQLSALEFMELLDLSDDAFRKHLKLARAHLRETGRPAVIQRPATNSGPYTWVVNSPSVELANGGRMARDKVVRGHTGNYAHDLAVEADLTKDKTKRMSLLARAAVLRVFNEIEQLEYELAEA